MQKIAAVLADKSDLDVIHMVSHGSAGAIRLGTSSLSASTLERYHSELTTIGQALTAEGDLLLYGCDVGRGSEGARFLSALAAATGADVAASINPTGNSALGGDWALEVASGSIESGGLAPLGALGVYTGLLDDDYSGDPYTTGTVAVGSSVTGDIETAGDRDWFAVTLTAGTTYRIDLAGDATGQGTLQDPYFWGVNSNAGVLVPGTSDDDGGDGLNSRVFYTPSATGTYYLAAGGVEWYDEYDEEYGDVGTYRLSVAVDDLPEDDYSGDPSTTGTVAVGGSVTGAIEIVSDHDWFAVTLTAGTTYRIDLEGDETGHGTLQDPYFQGVHSFAGELIPGTTDDDGGDGSNSRVFYTPSATGTYYLEAIGLDDDVGTYRLSVVTVTNHAPTASNRTLPTNEDTARVLAVADFGFSDIDVGDSLQAITLTSVPAAGSLKLNGTAVSANQVISAADLALGRLIFTPSANANGAGYTSFAFKVSDGSALSASAYTMAVNVTPVRDDLTLTGTGSNNTLVGDLIDLGSHDQLSGLGGNDRLSGGAGNDTLLGGTGNDSLFGGAGNDSLSGEAGNDTLNGNSGADTMVGGNGSDTYYVSSSGDRVVQSTPSLSTGGNDTVYSYLSAYTLPSNVEKLVLSSTGPTNGTGNGLANTLTGNSHANVLSGADGNDSLSGGAGSDTLNGNSGADTMVGGNGSDTYYVSSSGDLVVESTPSLSTGGNDTVYSYLSAYTLSSNVENLLLRSTDPANGTGNGLANTLTGNSRANVLSGAGGNDNLSGGDGNDNLSGGAGKDGLTGGSGGDTFDFNALSEMGLGSTTRDVITDFVRGQDRIDLSTLDANTTRAGNQSFSAPVVGNHFSSAFTRPGELYFDRVADVLYGNTDADAAAEFSIQITGLSSLSVTNLIL